MLKLLALYDRYHNIRGPQESRHDREEAQTHAADVVAIVKARPDLAEFRRQFEGQFGADPELGSRVNGILSDFFRDMAAPSYLLYEEYLPAALPAGRAPQVEIREESARAHRILQRILPGTKALRPKDEECQFGFNSIAGSHQLDSRGLRRIYSRFAGLGRSTVKGDVTIPDVEATALNSRE